MNFTNDQLFALQECLDSVIRKLQSPAHDESKQRVQSYGLQQWLPSITVRLLPIRSILESAVFDSTTIKIWNNNEGSLSLFEQNTIKSFFKQSNLAIQIEPNRDLWFANSLLKGSKIKRSACLEASQSLDYFCTIQY